MDEWLDGFRERWGTLALVILLGGSGLWWWSGRPLRQPPGALAPEDPLQAAPDPAAPWTFKNHTFTPLARFEIRARVLAAERYRFDRAAELSPVDFALGWGPMSDSRVLDAFHIQQRDRWYFWSSSHMPLSGEAVITHSANMHMIPATAAVERRLLAVREGQVVTLRGQLVRVDGRDGWHWVSSLSRADTGDGSCEVIWVESARAADR
jgi:hypothetical protein